MQVESFLPKYPSIKNTTEIFNMYQDENFNSVIFRKKEFYDLKIEDNDIGKIPNKGTLMKHQEIIARFLASHTLYDEIFLFHEAGTGKTCSAIGAIEQIFSEPISGQSFKGAVILVHSPSLMQSFFEQIILCTPGTYEDEEDNNPELTRETVRLRRKRRIGIKYKIDTHEQFVTKVINRMTDEQITQRFSNMIFVIDEAHHITERLYPSYKRFFSLLQNRKIIVMTGTPMTDTPAGIARIMNLILPDELQLPMRDGNIDNFITQMYDNDGNLTLQAKKVLSTIFTGRISFLRSVSGIKIEYQGRVVEPLRRLIVYPSIMGQEQWNIYKTINIEERFFQDASEASLFVYPNGQFGKVGENLFIRDGKMTLDLKRTLRHGSNRNDILQHIGRYSCKYANAIREIIQTDANNKLQNVFVFSESITGSGAIVFSQLLQLFGYQEINSSYKIRRNSKALRYAILSGNVNVDKIRKIFNDNENSHGDHLQILIGGRKVSEGFTFKNIQQIHIMQPHWNFSTIDQAIARGVRLNAHSGLPANTPVRVFLHVAISPEPNISAEKMIDLRMYKVAEEKDYMIKQVKRIAQTNSFDCGLTYNQNLVRDSYDGSRDCDYGDCLYRCNGLRINNYQINSVYPVIGNIAMIDYSTYNIFYTLNNRNIILDKLKQIFKTRFYIPLLEFFNQFNMENNKDVYQLLLSLQYIIELKKTIRNKFGYNCMLFHSNNTLYLDQDVYSKDYTSSYYTQYPTLVQKQNFTHVLKKVFEESIPNDIAELVRIQNVDEKIKAFKELAPRGQLMFLETILKTPSEMITGDYKLFSNSVLNELQSYIIRDNDIIYVTLLPDNIRVLRNNQWYDATENDINQILYDRFITQNTYKVFGTIRGDKFSIHDFRNITEFTPEIHNKIFKTSKHCTSFMVNDLRELASFLNQDTFGNKNKLCSTIQRFLSQNNLIVYR